MLHRHKIGKCGDLPEVFANLGIIPQIGGLLFRAWNGWQSDLCAPLGLTLHELIHERQGEGVFAVAIALDKSFLN